MTSTETRTVQERLRVVAEVSGQPRASMLRGAADRIDALEKALGGLLPLAINEGPGGCDGKTRGCPNCKIIKLARSALHPSDNETGGVGIK